MKRFIATLAAGLSLCFAVPVPGAPGAEAAGAPTNYGRGGYPAHNCPRPDLPDGNDKNAVALFNSRLEDYKLCITRYLAAAQADQQQVMDRANEAVDEFNRLLESWLDAGGGH